MRRDSGVTARESVEPQQPCAARQPGLPTSISPFDKGNGLALRPVQERRLAKSPMVTG